MTLSCPFRLRRRPSSSVKVKYAFQRPRKRLHTLVRNVGKLRCRFRIDQPLLRSGNNDWTFVFRMAEIHSHRQIIASGFLQRETTKDGGVRKDGKTPTAPRRMNLKQSLNLLKRGHFHDRAGDGLDFLHSSGTLSSRRSVPKRRIRAHAHVLSHT